MARPLFYNSLMRGLFFVIALWLMYIAQTRWTDGLRVVRCGFKKLRLCDHAGKTRLFTVGSVLVDDALGDRFIDRGRGSGILLGGSFLTLLQRGRELADGCLDAALHHTVAQVLLFADFHAFLGRLNVRHFLRLL